MTDINNETPLLQLHWRELIVGSSLLAFSAIMVLFAETVSGLIGMGSWLIEAVAAHDAAIENARRLRQVWLPRGPH